MVGCDSLTLHFAGPRIRRVKQVVTVRKRSMRQVKEFILKQTVGTVELSGNGVPIKRHQQFRYGCFHSPFSAMLVTAWFKG